MVEYSSPGSRTKYTHNATSTKSRAISTARCRRADGSTVTCRRNTTMSRRTPYSMMVASSVSVVTAMRRPIAPAITGTVNT